ncbi:MAG: Mut7-C RNAse domain-containing protein [Burkholderiales bacterium]|nr:Mut7-C RNAse domain-containing protein [Burkholderiales bacterium]PZN05041.1 MAG: hypothetical protein DIU74_02690 [Pseudomonadota bacterium]
MNDAANEAYRFLADAMLGRLARWLRMLGYDTWYDAAADDHSLVMRADYERRIVLTRDRHLIEHLRPARVLRIVSDDPLLQLREVVSACRIEAPAACFTRCMVCNTPLQPVSEEEYRLRVPRGLEMPIALVRRCPGCARVYWPGSHTARMLGRLRERFPEWRL